MSRESIEKEMTIETLVQDLSKEQKQLSEVVFQRGLGELEVEGVVEYSQVGQDRIVEDLLSAKGGHPVKNGQRIPKGSIGFFSDQVQG